jgi:protein gp37
MIQYADRTWNPLTGCDGPVSAGCAHCWAQTMARRLAGRVGYPPWPQAFGPRLWPSRLNEPTRWRRPQRVAVSFMGDIGCHPVYHLLALREACRSVPRHLYLLLTKRLDTVAAIDWPGCCLLGTSVEDQDTYDRRVTGRGDCRLDWVSIEPMLGPIRLDDRAPPWIVLGREHGPGARHCEGWWIQHLIVDAHQLGRRVFYKDFPHIAGDLPETIPF